MTEEQARVTQCCGGEGCGYVNPEDGIRYCVGSFCMAWRWKVKVDIRILVTVHLVSTTDGFCGLAGKP